MYVFSKLFKTAGIFYDLPPTVSDQRKRADKIVYIIIETSL